MCHIRSAVVSCLLIALLVSQVPLFLQMSLTPDTVLYDLQSQCVSRGGVLYRDIVEPNLPGVVWLHLAVRGLAGDSAVVLRIFDLLIVGGIAAVLGLSVWYSLPGNGFSGRSGTLPSSDRPDPDRDASDRLPCSAVSIGVAAIVFSFYFGTSEWCHCQRDTWMLLPCLLAAGCRARVSWKTAVPTERDTDFHKFIPVLEGVLWGVAVWLKPFVVIPALFVIAASFAIPRSASQTGSHTDLSESDHRIPRRNVPCELMMILFGGLLVGASGIWWMTTSGCWQWFAETMTEWNGQYFRSGRNRWTPDRLQAHAERFGPWIWLHVPAIILAIRLPASGIPRPVSGNGGARSDTELSAAVASGLLHALYLGWMLQAFALQQLFDYVHVPGLFLAMTICVRHVAVSFRTMPGNTVSGNLSAALVFALIVSGIVNSPVTRWPRLRLWPECVAAGFSGCLSDESRDDLSIGPFPRWMEFQPILEKLRSLQAEAEHGGILAYSGNTIHVYPAMGCQPPTRFVYVDALARCFPDRRGDIVRDLERSSVRYIVADLMEDGWHLPIESSRILPESLMSLNFFPYNQTPIFRSGSYVIFERTQPVASLTADYVPLSILQNRLATRSNQRH